VIDQKRNLATGELSMVAMERLL